MLTKTINVNEEAFGMLTKTLSMEDRMLTEAFGMLTKEVNKGDRRLTKKKSGLSSELAVKKRDLHERDYPRRRRRPRL